MADLLEDQKKAIEVLTTKLLDGGYPDIDAAAVILQITPQTLRDWFKDAAFQEEHLKVIVANAKAEKSQEVIRRVMDDAADGKPKAQELAVRNIMGLTDNGVSNVTINALSVDRETLHALKPAIEAREAVIHRREKIKDKHTKTIEKYRHLAATVRNQRRLERAKVR